MVDDPSEKRKFDELRLLYNCVAEIASFKQHQWQLTNYGLLLYAAVASLPKLFGKLTEAEYASLHFLLLVIVAAGWFILGLFADSIQVRRSRLTEIRKYFSTEFREAWRYGRPESEVPTTRKSR